MPTSEEIRRDIRNELDSPVFLDIRFSYGRNAFHGRAIHRLLASPTISFQLDPSERIHYDRARNRFHLRFRRGVSIDYRWSLIAHESAHCLVDFRYGLRLVDDEVCAHLFQVVYYRRRTGSYDLGFAADSLAGRVFEAAVAIVRSHDLASSSARTVTADDAADLKRALRAYGYRNEPG